MKLDGKPEVAEAAAPESEKKDADEDEGGAEADPEAKRTPVEEEAEPTAEGQPDEPVTEEVAEHGGARVSGAPKSAGGDGLQAVEKLEGGSGGEQGNRGMDKNRIVRIDAGDVLGNDEKDDAHARHEGGAEEDGGVAGVARAGEVAASDGLAHANGSGGGDAEGNHVSEGDGVERDLMAGKGNGAEAGDKGGDSGEDADFGSELDGGGKAEINQAAHAGEVGNKRRAAKAGVVVSVVPEKKDNQHRSKVGAGNGGGDAGADNPEPGESEVAEDEDIVAEYINDIGGD